MLQKQEHNRVIPKMTNVEIAWLAGLLEGEGCFSTPKRRSGFVKLGMTDKDTVVRASKLMNGKVSKSKTDHRGGRKPEYICHVHGMRARQVMELILPYMGKRRAKTIIEKLKLPSWGFQPKGSSRKLNEYQVRKILTSRKSNTEVAKEMGVAQPTISAIRSGKSWRNIYKEYAPEVRT